MRVSFPIPGQADTPKLQGSHGYHSPMIKHQPIITPSSFINHKKEERKKLKLYEQTKSEVYVCAAGTEQTRSKCVIQRRRPKKICRNIVSTAIKRLSLLLSLSLSLNFGLGHLGIAIGLRGLDFLVALSSSSSIGGSLIWANVVSGSINLICNFLVFALRNLEVDLTVLDHVIELLL